MLVTEKEPISEKWCKVFNLYEATELFNSLVAAFKLLNDKRNQLIMVELNIVDKLALDNPFTIPRNTTRKVHKSNTTQNHPNYMLQDTCSFLPVSHIYSIQALHQ